MYTAKHNFSLRIHSMAYRTYSHVCTTNQWIGYAGHECRDTDELHGRHEGTEHSRQHDDAEVEK